MSSVDHILLSLAGRSEFVSGFVPVYRLVKVRAIVALEFFPVRPPARHRRAALCNRKLSKKLSPQAAPLPRYF
jgi:hypothetical protein